LSTIAHFYYKPKRPPFYKFLFTKILFNKMTTPSANLKINVDEHLASLIVGKLTYPITDSTSGDVVATNGTGTLSLTAPGQMSVVAIPINSLAQVGGILTPNFGTPRNVFGKAAQYVSIVPLISGTDIVCSKQIYRIWSTMSSQYALQVVPSQTTMEITVGDVPQVTQIDGIPTGDPNFNLGQSLEFYDVNASASLNVILTTTAAGAVTLSSGIVYLNILV
jgi:hypothetical protein